ncbi:ElaB/YqjD/DUF883 family membrane-anchored ribosome-binding protein [Paraburkholderia caribensis]|nr:ElaB/YqjD/DUF883 family membrane-anchored ribosome-binding protein [Paraburkholderia caribensis]
MDQIAGRASKLRQRILPALCCGDTQTTLIDGATMTALPNTRDALGESWTTAGRRARRIARHSRHAAEDIASELRTLMTELENTLGDGTQADAAVLRTQMRKRLDEARTRLNDTRDAMRERAEAAIHDADDYVHENPWRTIAIVGGVALIAGALLARGGSR